MATGNFQTQRFLEWRFTGSFNPTNHFTLFTQFGVVVLASQVSHKSIRCLYCTIARCKINLLKHLSSTIDGQGSIWWKTFHKKKLKNTRPYFIKGRYIGGAEEEVRLHEQGKFRPLLAGIPFNTWEGPYEGCGGIRFVVYFSCSGSGKFKNVIVSFLVVKESMEFFLIDTKYFYLFIDSCDMTVDPVGCWSSCSLALFVTEKKYECQHEMFSTAFFVDLKS
ncbi:hypothetical protein L1987_45439 [Smallanthus sonchifolius]|uniref:Uncharacterized protein n=1 Tax=Smallanthus sonchifolius TaxID=185202 RepID=A0ACB9FXY0_9ASTR|nr:hypothetical protein L1987_45439 [Smallanthus sonchifolius]